MGPDIFMSGPLRSEGEEERAVSVEVSVRAATERGFNDYIAGEKALERAFGVCRVPGAIRIGRPERPAAYKYFVIIVGACCRGRAAIIGKRANDRKNEDPIEEGTEAFDLFTETLRAIAIRLARMVAKDGEGATKLLVCKVTGAASDADARTVAKSVICSSLLKAAMFGADANWGRVLCAIGYSGAPVDIHRVDVGFASQAGSIEVCVNGAGIPFDEEVAKKVLSEDEIDILVTLHDGNASASAFGCDLTYDYVKINGDYRT